MGILIEVIDKIIELKGFMSWEKPLLKTRQTDACEAQ